MSRGGMRGGRGMVKGFGPPGRGRGRGKDGAMNGFGPMRYSVREVLSWLSINDVSCQPKSSNPHATILLPALCGDPKGMFNLFCLTPSM